MKHLALTTLTLTLCTGWSGADVLRPERVSADATWLAHLDVDAVRASSLWGLVSASEHINVTDGLADLDEVEAKFGIHPLHDLKSITAYGAEEGSDTGVALLSVTDRIDGALERLKSEEGYRAVSHDGLELHTWDDDGDRVYAYVHASGAERVVVFSDDAVRAAFGVRVLLGQSPSLATGTPTTASPLVARPMPGSMVFFAAGPELSRFEDFEPASAIAGLAKELVFDLAESQGLLQARATLVAENVEDAMNVAQILQGLKALLSLSLLGDDDIPPAVRQMANALQFNARGQEVVIEFAYDVRRLFEELEALEAR